MPVFNEEGCVEAVLEEWTKELEQAGLEYGWMLFDDGSTDRTPTLS
jgi:glycosyltransferase involved in cell wall biosynthesis